MKSNYRLKHCEKLLEKGLTKEQIINLLKTKSSRNKNYWLERGYSDDESLKMSNSRMPGTIEYFTLYKKVSIDEAELLVKKFKEDRINTEENFIKKYGIKEGFKKWNSYCEKHRIKNTFEYKNKILGWNKKQFNEYNKSRSVTLENFVKKYGDQIGREKWVNYVERQSYTKSSEYVINKYGIEEWEKLCKSKSNTYESFLLRNDNNIEIATEKYNEYIKLYSKQIVSSKIADDLFSNIVNGLVNTNYKQYYCCVYNQEWYLNIKNYGCVFLDFFLKDNGKVIEFYGDYWHANPKKYKPDTHIKMKSGMIKKVEEIWELDRIRIDHILKTPYIKYLKIIWESDFRERPSEIIQECLNFLKNEIYNR